MNEPIQIFLGFAVLAATLAGAAILTALAIAAIRRDRGKRGGSGSLSAAMLEVQSLLEPSKRHQAHSVRAEDPENEAESGDPPTR